MTTSCLVPEILNQAQIMFVAMSTVSLKAEFGIWFLNLVCTKLCVCFYCDQKTLSLFYLSRVSHSSGSGLCLYIFIRKTYFLFYFEQPRLFAGTPAMWIIFVLCLYNCLNINLDSSGYKGLLHILLLNLCVWPDLFLNKTPLFLCRSTHNNSKINSKENTKP